ncbi:efflux RND transporter periplasmic adaptor subunit [Pseudidiomarina sediminum]|uniref:Efflux RND transporter periplasmic adaptor subunit n=1 Tax=Pseudidiomarina sediminum TaxID=431675 RepID=A0A432Z2E5_9GAMM|nr:efflux RND transporter periplasmic adaptor subunit [Pseudidiomarina sediminum]MBY6064362.1 efflux RND transporter periplasmic adaptor subunit [Pseudidiomarina sediminum]RUO72037.1 efflux RND transporter periplasmic adaptor subunit [Pseudidiomarina sediminum]
MTKLFNPISLVVVLLAVAAVYFSFLHTPSVEEQRPQRAVPVKVTEVVKQPFRDIIESLATARANESVMITAQAQDKVVAVHFDDGDTVATGQLLVELDAREEQARVQELKFRLAEASRQYQRLQDLRKQNAASAQQVEAQDVVVKEIVAALEVAETQLAQKRVLAPFDGRLGIRQVSLGSLVTPGQQITTLDDITPIKLDFNVPELFFASLAVGQTVTAISGAYPEHEFKGTIRSIDSRVDPVTRSILVRAEVSNSEGLLRPGMLLRVQLLRSVDTVMQLPERAIVPLDSRHFVYVLNDDNTASQRQVSIGRRRPGMVEVIDGLEVGERVVTDGIVRMRDGIAVTVKEG